MKKLITILLCLPIIGFGQLTYVPDNNFEQALINLGYDNVLDDYVQTSNINTLTTIDLSSKSISDLTGIEDFDSLQTLYCMYNQLTTLDVSQNTALTGLDCWYNQLTTLDVSNNTALTTLWCGENQLTCLDISSNTALTGLGCEKNLLEQLNTKNGNWINMGVNAINNNLTCVEVDNLGYANSNWINTFDNFVTFSTNCNYANPCNTTSGIEEHTINKELLKVTDLLGRETNQTNQPLFYIYDDGTVEKRIVIE